jgi:phosphoribosylamine--glycine ligase
VDGDRCGLDLALRSIAAGHDVKIFRPPGSKVRDGEGFPGLVITSDLKAGLKWAKDGMITTTANCKYIDELDRWRSFGYPVFGPTKASAKLEIDRKLGQEVMRQHGMIIPPYHEFKSLKDALGFARKTDKCFVHKPMGDEEDKALTFVPKNPAQLVEWLENKIKSGGKIKGSVMLQEKIDGMICEVGIAGFMGSHGFLEDKWEISFEHKKLMPGDFGPATGEQGTVIQLVKDGKLPEILKSFEAHLRAIGHTGDVAINGAVTESGDYLPFEWTMRCGWPDDPIRRSLHKTDECKWMKAALEGRDELEVSYDCAIGVVVAQRPYPYGDGSPEEVEGKPIYGVEDVSENIHFMQVMMASGFIWDGKKTVSEKIPKTTGPYVLIATGHGKTVSDAHESVMKTVKSISLADMIVRNDIGMKLKVQLPELHKLGYCEEIEFGDKE